MSSYWNALFNDWLSIENADQVSDLQAPKNITKANQTPNRTARPKDEVQGIENLMGGYPDFDNTYIKNIPQQLEPFRKAVKFLLNSSTSTVPYPKFDAAKYF